jgi:hypothetical protein
MNKLESLTMQIWRQIKRKEEPEHLYSIKKVRFDRIHSWTQFIKNFLSSQCREIWTTVLYTERKRKLDVSWKIITNSSGSSLRKLYKLRQNDQWMIFIMVIINDVSPTVKYSPIDSQIISCDQTSLSANNLFYYFWIVLKKWNTNRMSL